MLNDVEIVFWPVAMDIKYDDLQKLPELDASIVSGSIRNEENEHITRTLRNKSRYLVSFGSCACEGGTLGLANLSSREEILKTIYDEGPTNNNPHRKRPSKIFQVDEGVLKLPALAELNRPIDRVVKVDYYLSGCPPPIELIVELFKKMVIGNLPKPGSYIGPNKSVCDECDRQKVSDTVKSIDRYYRVNTDPNKCFLEQRILCMGPATRGGCGAKCPQANASCTGCGGRLSVLDQGARMIGALGSLLPTDDQDMMKLLEGLRDPVGSLYRYSLSASLIEKGVGFVKGKGKNDNRERK